MAEGYLEQLSALMEQATSGKIWDKLECKHFFSGAAVYINGKICMSLTPVGFAIKLPENLREAGDRLAVLHGGVPDARGTEPARARSREPVTSTLDRSAC